MTPRNVHTRYPSELVDIYGCFVVSLFFFKINVPNWENIWQWKNMTEQETIYISSSLNGWMFCEASRFPIHKTRFWTHWLNMVMQIYYYRTYFCTAPEHLTFQKIPHMILLIGSLKLKKIDAPKCKSLLAWECELHNMVTCEAYSYRTLIIHKFEWKW